MEINSFGVSVQGSSTFGTLNTEGNKQSAVGASGDIVDISDEAKELHSLMQEPGKDVSEMSSDELEVFLAENPEAAAMQETNQANEQSSSDQSSGDKSSGAKPSGGGGQGSGGGSSASTDATTSQTNLEAEILEIEMQIAKAEEEAEKTGNNAQVEALEAELKELEDELDELTEA